MTKKKECYCVPFDNNADPCLGFLPGVANACCGHGDKERAYVQMMDGSIVSGEDAITMQSILKKADRTNCDIFLNYKISDFEVSKNLV